MEGGRRGHDDEGRRATVHPGRRRRPSIRTRADRAVPRRQGVVDALGHGWITDDAARFVIEEADALHRMEATLRAEDTARL